MEVKDRSVVYLWTARILAIAFASFLLLFGFDVFEGDASLLEELLAFLIHSLPSILIFLAALLPWRRPDISAYAFLLIALVFTLWFRTYREILHFAMLSLPLMLIGALFLLAHSSRKGKAQ